MVLSSVASFYGNGGRKFPDKALSFLRPEAKPTAAVAAGNRPVPRQPDRSERARSPPQIANAKPVVIAVPDRFRLRSRKLISPLAVIGHEAAHASIILNGLRLLRSRRSELRDFG